MANVGGQGAKEVPWAAPPDHKSIRNERLDHPERQSTVVCLSSRPSPMLLLAAA